MKPQISPEAAAGLVLIASLTALLTGCASCNQGTRIPDLLKKVEVEAARLRAETRSLDTSLAANWKRHRSASLQSATRDWVESQLPRSRPDAYALTALQSKVDTELLKSGLHLPKNQESTYGYVERIAIRSLEPEYPQAIAVASAVTAPCGHDDSVYVYDYSTGVPLRVLESHGARESDQSLSTISAAKQDGAGNRLLLTIRYGIGCASTWNQLGIDLYRLSPGAKEAQRILATEHNIWFGGSPYHVRLTPDDLLLELRDIMSIDVGLHNRAHVLHYRITPQSVERTDPVALQPEDFVDEWLSRPWSEMRSRSASDSLEEWHNKKATELSGTVNFAQACSERPGYWQVALEPNDTQPIYFLIKDIGKSPAEKYRFQMEEISAERQPGCPGEMPPKKDDTPTLFPDKQ